MAKREVTSSSGGGSLLEKLSVRTLAELLSVNPSSVMSWKHAAKEINEKNRAQLEKLQAKVSEINARDGLSETQIINILLSLKKNGLKVTVDSIPTSLALGFEGYANYDLRRILQSKSDLLNGFQPIADQDLGCDLVGKDARGNHLIIEIKKNPSLATLGEAIRLLSIAREKKFRNPKVIIVAENFPADLLRAVKEVKGVLLQKIEVKVKVTLVDPSAG